MIRGLSLVMCITAVECTRLVDVEEHGVESQSVPRVIMGALRGAGKHVDEHLEKFEAANSLAEQRKADSEAKINEKLQAMKDVKVKTEEAADKAKASRDTMLKLEKATVDHSKAGEEQEKSVTKFGEISDDYDDLSRKINLKEQALRQVVTTYKKQIAEMKAKLDALSEDKKKAEEEVFELKAKTASAKKLKSNVQQEQVKATKSMQTAQQELDKLRQQLDTAVSAATVAEAEAQEAVNQAREANATLNGAKKTKDLLMQIRNTVRYFYDSLYDLESKVEESKTMDVPENTAALEKYNMMITAFRVLSYHDPQVYDMVGPAVKEVKDNAWEHIGYICDMTGASSKPMPNEAKDAKSAPKSVSSPQQYEHCLEAYWVEKGMAKLDFPE